VLIATDAGCSVAADAAPCVASVEHPDPLAAEVSRLLESCGALENERPFDAALRQPRYRAPVAAQDFSLVRVVPQRVRNESGT
jgi:hypothetical protein